MYNKEELPSFKTKDECFKKIKFYLDNQDKLQEVTQKFHQKSLNYEDSNYIKKIEAFINKLEPKKNYNFSEPIWYNLIFLNQTLRLRFKRKYILTFFKEFYDKLTTKSHNNNIIHFINVISIILLFIRYLPFLLMKVTFEFNKKFKNPQEL